MVTLHPFLADFLHWPTRRTHRPTTLCRECGHTAHACRPTSRQFLLGLRVECIKMEEQLLLLETPLLKILVLEDERSDWVNPIFYEREKCGEFHPLFPMLLEQTLKFFQYFITGPDTFWYILHNIKPYIGEQWDRTTKALTTKEFFPNIKDRLNTKITLTSNFMSFVTSHGKTKSYLHRFKIMESPDCPCGGGSQTVDHLLFD